MRPRLVLCKMPAAVEGEESILHVVKYRQQEQGKGGICSLISEIVGSCLLQAAGVPCIEPRLAVTSQEFADQCNQAGTIAYTVYPGIHFASPYLRGEAGPVVKLTRLAQPQQVVDLWVMDCWLCTNDRQTEGNVLLVPVIGEKCELYAVDQSDCFSGPQRFSDGSWITVLRGDRRAEDAGCLSEAVFSCGGPVSIEQALKRVDAAHLHLHEVIARVPSEWWPAAGVDPGVVREELDRRYRNLPAIVDLQSWPDPKNFGGGAHLLGGGGNE
jgi:hypothetical protein